MHIATLLEIRGHTLPLLGELINAVWSKAVQWRGIIPGWSPTGSA